MTVDASWGPGFGHDNFGRCRKDECLPPVLVAAVLSLFLTGRLRWRYPLDLAGGGEEEEGWFILPVQVANRAGVLRKRNSTAISIFKFSCRHPIVRCFLLEEMPVKYFQP